MVDDVAVVAFDRLRMLWGALDWQHGSDNPYTAGQTSAGGASAAPGAGNVGVRRASLIIDRSLFTPADDDLQMHFDWLNVTGGTPDDTWTTADYTTLEALMQLLWGQVATLNPSSIRLREIRWYRHGPGVVPPNPAQRVWVLPVPHAGSSTDAGQPPQVACSITFRTAVRRSWGRTYAPCMATTLATGHRMATAKVNSLATAMQTMVTDAAAADFRLVVTSVPLQAALNVEKVEVDDILDIQRSRRWKHTGYRKILP